MIAAMYVKIAPPTAHPRLESEPSAAAMQELDEALQINVSPTVVTPKLLDLYCDTGQPEKALDLLATSVSIDDPNLGSEPGLAALRQGRVYFLLGNYKYASTLWEKNAIPQLRLERSYNALGAAQMMLHGSAKTASNLFLGLPGKLNTQAVWENDLALCELESGEPTVAARDFSHALTLVPDLPTRAVSAYYLEKLGKPVPALPKTADDTKAKTDEKAREEGSGSTPKPEEKPDAATKDEKPEAAGKDAEKP